MMQLYLNASKSEDNEEKIKLQGFKTNVAMRVS